MLKCPVTQVVRREVDACLGCTTGEHGIGEPKEFQGVVKTFATSGPSERHRPEKTVFPSQAG